MSDITRYSTTNVCIPAIETYFLPAFIHPRLFLSSPGPGRALVQLKIDAMFTAGGPLKVSPTSTELTSVNRVEENSGAVEKEEGMDVDVVVAPSAALGAEVASGPNCYVCQGGLASDGGDILCVFCDRAVCEGCSQNCFTCDLPHCRMCLSADFGTQFECYLCPPCHRDTVRKACGGSADIWNFRRM